MNSRAALPARLGFALPLCLVALTLGQPAPVAAHPSSHGEPIAPEAHGAMNDAAMKRQSESWWASHPRVGLESALAPAATFAVTGLRFDADANSATPVDTARISVGESVLWQWIDGFHTVTSGSGSTDPNAGALFDQPSDPGHPQFTFAFNSAGTFPFFCVFHEFVNMRGVVIVSTPLSVDPPPGGLIGFTAQPWPNPSRSGMSFGFRTREPGRAVARVFDVRGRLVAVILDRDLAAGPHTGTWNERGPDGVVAPAGVYYVRLQLPGFNGARRFVVAR